MTNKEKLEQLIVDIFLLEPDEFSFDLKKESVDSWDSLGTIAMAVGVQETFGHHMKPEEAVAVGSVQDIIDYLESKGVSFSE